MAWGVSPAQGLPPALPLRAIIFSFVLVSLSPGLCWESIQGSEPSACLGFGLCFPRGCAARTYSGAGRWLWPSGCKASLAGAAGGRKEGLLRVF